MKILFPFMMIVSVVCGFVGDSMGNLTNSVLGGSENAIKLFLTLAGSMAFWNGIMNIVLKSGMVDLLGKILSPVIGVIFKNIDKSKKAYKLIVMNITANLLGLGNAATPSGIEAVRELSKEEKSDGYATKNIAKLIVLNTASIQIFPVTVGILRLKHGSENPFEILPCVLITSLISVVVGLLAVEVLSGFKRDRL
ncbi:MAG: spore maturation protein A [Oscillospiraceae bacterium]|nr:spore maturation protein A [Oscillospiraceae bacterium]